MRAANNVWIGNWPGPPAFAPVISLGRDSCMSRRCLNCNSRARHEVNGRQPGGIGRASRIRHKDLVSCPVLICPISKLADTIVFGEGKLRIAREKAELTDLSTLHTHRRWCAGSNPIAC